ncbi:MAG: FAD-dependent oxidoreductase, partial [Candidatus Lokiarchaeota archaeon]|nr:FAD-dependent oxidoreductase [Candidatus Lokiarchaeota archaeon]
CQMIPNITDLLEFFDIDIELKEYTGDYMRIFLVDIKTNKVRTINLASGFEDFKNGLIEKYPNNATEIDHFLDYSRALYLELFKLKLEPTFIEILKMLLACPKIVKNSSKTFKEYFAQFGITEPDVIEIFAIFAEFSGLPADRVSATVPVSVMNSLLDGAFRPKGGFIEFPKKFEEKYLSLGGELMLNTKVSKILIEGGETKGVRLDDGREFYSDLVVTTVDPIVAMNEMVGIDIIRDLDKKYADKVENVKMSTSSININIGLDDEIDLGALGLDCGYNVITTGGDIYDRLFDDMLNGKIGYTDEEFRLGVICPSLTTGGKPNIALRIVPMGIDDWTELREKDPKQYNEKKQKWADFFIEKTEKYLIPDLRKHIKVVDVSTPATYARYSGSPSGAIYDMAPYPDNFGRTRLAMRTPVKGLYQPKFVHSVFATLLAGMQVNDMFLKRQIMNGNARYKA